MLSYHQTPVHDIHHPVLEKAGLRLLVKREDLNHVVVSGNKWWKLKYNLEEALREGHDTILTFGGAYSNHIYATAAAAKTLNLKSVGIIRGEQTLPLNPTLQFAAQHEMDLYFLSRSEYGGLKGHPNHPILREKFGSFYGIPEGGTNVHAIKGCEEFGNQIDRIACDYVCLPVGTGGTMAGIIKGTSVKKIVLGFAVLKNAGFLEDDIKRFCGNATAGHWKLITDYAYGGYGKRNDAVTAFIKDFFERTNVPLDFVYTGKMMCALFEKIKKQYFKKGTTILAIHTGGLQGHS